jgi:hypothetical protein
MCVWGAVKVISLIIIVLTTQYGDESLASHSDRLASPLYTELWSGLDPELFLKERKRGKSVSLPGMEHTSADKHFTI